MLFTSQGIALKLPVHQSAQSPRSTSASCWHGCKRTVKMEPIPQVIISFYRCLVVFMIYDFLYRIHWLIFATPITFAWVIKHLYRVKYLQVSYRIQGPFFANPHNIWLGFETPISSKNCYQGEFIPRIDRLLFLLPISTRISRLGQTNSGSNPSFSLF